MTRPFVRVTRQKDTATKKYSNSILHNGRAFLSNVAFFGILIRLIAHFISKLGIAFYPLPK